MSVMLALLQVAAEVAPAPAAPNTITTWMPVLGALLGGGLILGLLKWKPEKVAMEVATARAALEAVREASSSLQVDLSRARKESGRLTEELEQVRTDSTALGESLHALRSESAALGRDLRRSRGRVASLEQQLTTADERHRADEAEIGWLRRRVAQLEGMAARLSGG